MHYWQTLESLQALMAHPAHVAAKQSQARWLEGFQVVIARVVACYGDQRLAHPLAHLALPCTDTLPERMRDPAGLGAPSLALARREVWVDEQPSPTRLQRSAS